MPTAVKSKPKYSLDIYDLDLTDLSFEWRAMDTEEFATRPQSIGLKRPKYTDENVLLTYALLANLETGYNEIFWQGDHSTLFGLHALGISPEQTSNPVVNLVFIDSKETHYFVGEVENLAQLAYKYNQEFYQKKQACDRIVESNPKIRAQKRSELFESKRDYQAYLYGRQVYTLYKMSANHKEFKQVLTTNPVVEVWI